MLNLVLLVAHRILVAASHALGTPVDNLLVSYGRHFVQAAKEDGYEEVGAGVRGRGGRGHWGLEKEGSRATLSPARSTQDQQAGTGRRGVRRFCMPD
jgi:hypothetical protein